MVYSGRWSIYESQNQSVIFHDHEGSFLKMNAPSNVFCRWFYPRIFDEEVSRLLVETWTLIYKETEFSDEILRTLSTL